MDENQLSRLATGVTVDTSGPASAAVRANHSPPALCVALTCDLSSAYRKAGEACVRRVAQRCDPCSRRGERSATTVVGHLDGVEDSVPEAATEDASRVHRTAGVRLELQVLGDHQARLQSRRWHLLPPVSTSRVCRDRLLRNSVNRPSQGASPPLPHSPSKHRTEGRPTCRPGLRRDADGPLQSTHPQDLPRNAVLPDLCRQLRRRLLP